MSEGPEGALYSSAIYAQRALAVGRGQRALAVFGSFLRSRTKADDALRAYIAKRPLKGRKQPFGYILPRRGTLWAQSETPFGHILRPETARQRDSETARAFRPIKCPRGGGNILRPPKALWHIIFVSCPKGKAKRDAS